MRDTYRNHAGAGRVRAWCQKVLSEWSTPHTVRELETSLGPTAIVEAGDGPDLCVYLPGANYNASTSLPLIDALAASCRVWAVDLPGQPGLSAAGRPDRLEEHSPWVREVLLAARKAHPRARIVLVGLSRGAAIALLAPPDLVDALALVSPGGLVAVHPSFRMAALGLRWSLERSAGASHSLLSWMAATGRHPLPEHVEWMTLVVQTSRLTLAPDACPRPTLERWRGRKVGVIVGAEDVFFPSAQLRDASVDMVRVTPVVVPWSGHLLFSEDPGRVAEAVAHLLK